MRYGLLWYDGDRKKSVADKIAEGATCYEEKFGQKPNACHASPDMAAAHPGLGLVPNKRIQTNYFWLGVEED